jgi:hypothetical protein
VFGPGLEALSGLFFLGLMFIVPAVLVLDFAGIGLSFDHDFDVPC